MDGYAHKTLVCVFCVERVFGVKSGNDILGNWTCVGGRGEIALFDARVCVDRIISFVGLFWSRGWVVAA